MCTLQKRDPCDSCPFVNNNNPLCFEPDTLKQTIVIYFTEGRIHPCHAANKYMCAGQLSFAEQTLEYGVMTLTMARFAHALGLLDPDMIDTSIPVFNSLEELLESHQTRSRFSYPVDQFT